MRGPIPSKKNNMRRSRNGGMFHDRDTATLVATLTAQLRAQWRGAPVSRKVLGFRLRVADNRGDSDNKVTTLLDCMQAAGVLRNDNTAHLRRWLVDVSDGEAGADIGIFESMGDCAQWIN